MSYTIRLLVIALLLSVGARAQKNLASMGDINKLYLAMYKAAELPADRDVAFSLANKTIVVELEISKDGKLKGTELIKSTGTSVDDKMILAINKFKKWTPSTLDSKPINDKVRIAAYYTEQCEFRIGQYIPVPEVTINDLVRHLEQNVLSQMADKLGGESGGMTIQITTDNSGEMKDIKLTSFFALGHSKQVEDLMANALVRMPKINTRRDDVRYLKFHFLLTYIDGRYKVQRRTLAQPVGGDAEFNRYINKNVKGNSNKYVYALEAQFEVEDDGTISKVQLTRGKNEKIGEDYKKALEESPRWIPATLDGEPVKSKQLLGVKLMVGGDMRIYMQKLPSYPGGSSELATFTARYLNKYENEIRSTLNSDDKIIVKWEIGIDGNVRSHKLYSRNIHIQQALNEMQKEMPTWESAKTNGLYSHGIYWQTLDLFNYTKNK